MTDLRSWMTLVEGAVPSSNLLLELDWYDRSPLTAVLQRNRGRWIHFSNGVANRKPNSSHIMPEPDRNDYIQGGYGFTKGLERYKKDLARVKRMNAMQAVPKLGVNPTTPFHGDPSGIYFYPVDWLLTGTERLRNGQQYGQTMPFYYIVDLDLNSADGVWLDRISWPQVEAIADRNGWRAEMDAFRAEPEQAQRTQMPSYAAVDKPGSFLWHFVEHLVRARRTTWLKALRGVTFIRDENGAIIHNHEPDQVLVLDPSIIHIVEQGENKVVASSIHDGRPHWMHAITAILKAVRGELGGDLTWKDKRPSLSVKLGWVTATIALPDRNTDTQISVTYRYGRAVGDFTIRDDALVKQTHQQIVDEIVGKLKHVAALKTDLSFKPAIDVKTAKTMIMHEVGAGQGFSFEETVRNDAGRRYNRLQVKGSSQQSDGPVAIEDDVYVETSPDTFKLAVAIRFNGKHFAYGNSEMVPPGERDSALDQLTASLVESLESFYASVSGERGYKASWQKWSDPKKLAAYKGWVALNCGVSIGGRLRKHYAVEVAAYEALDEDERDDLAYSIRNKHQNLF